MARFPAGDIDLKGVKDGRRGSYLRDAPRASLTRVPATEEAQALAMAVVALVEAHEAAVSARSYRRGPAAQEKLARASAAWLGALLTARGRGRWGGLIFCDQSRAAFSRTAILQSDILSVRDVLTSAELVEHFPGLRPSPHLEIGGKMARTLKSRAARFRATPELIALAEEHGVAVEHSADHFRLPPRTQPSPAIIRLKTTKTRIDGRPLEGVPMDVPECPQVAAIRADLETITRRLDNTLIEGARFSGLFRQFEMGDRPGFDWTTGGRLYAVGEDHHQQLKKAQRLAIRLDGEPVVEIDIKASHLTILYGKTGLPFDFSQDPYALLGIERQVAKMWITASMTNGRALERWSPDQRKGYAKAHPGRNLGSDYKPARVEGAVRLKHPVLRDLANLPLNWAQLTYIESEVVIRSMLDLIARGATSLPVHDSLIVPASHEELAAGLLKGHFETLVGIPPVLDVRRPDHEDPGRKGSQDAPGSRPLHARQ